MRRKYCDTAIQGQVEGATYFPIYLFNTSIALKQSRPCQLRGSQHGPEGTRANSVCGGGASHTHDVKSHTGLIGSESLFTQSQL